MKKRDCIWGAAALFSRKREERRNRQRDTGKAGGRLGSKGRRDKNCKMRWACRPGVEKELR